MHLLDHLAKPEPTLSLEFFPPRHAEAARKFERTLNQLAPLHPDFVSVTYGAGGSSRQFTTDCVDQLVRDSRFDPVPHLTCFGHRKSEIESHLDHYASLGVSNVLALRGDRPDGAPADGGDPGDFQYAADLVRRIRRYNDSGKHPDKRGFGIGVAAYPEGHPETPNRLREMDHLKAKVDAGADYLCTQAFFDNADFHDFRARCDLTGIRVPILAGILPLTSKATMIRMADLAGGIRYPARLQRALDRAGEDPEAFRRIGIHHAVQQCADLLNQGVDGIHLYTLNQAAPVLEVTQRLAWHSRLERTSALSDGLSGSRKRFAA